MKLTPFAVLNAAVVTAAAVVFAVSPAVGDDSAVSVERPQAVDQPLSALGKRHDLRIGTAVNMDALANDATYRDRISVEFSTVTPENVMKWDTTEPQRGVFNFAPGDALVEFARANHQKVRGHTLLWHNQLPRWLTNPATPWTKDELLQILHDHIMAVAGHYKGRIWQWDVVNEVFNDSGSLRSTIWLNTIGPEYIEKAFIWAHEADPEAKLFINDYNVEGINTKSTLTYNLVVDLLARHVPIDGFGAQGHLDTRFNVPDDTRLNLKRFEDLGLDTALTEVDVRLPNPPVPPVTPDPGNTESTKVQAQAEAYSVLMQACLISPRCISFTVWGFTDKYSWVPSVFTTEGRATLLTDTFQVKPAYRKLQVDLALATGPRVRDRP